MDPKKRSQMTEPVGSLTFRNQLSESGSANKNRMDQAVRGVFEDKSRYGRKRKNIFCELLLVGQVRGTLRNYCWIYQCEGH